MSCPPQLTRLEVAERTLESAKLMLDCLKSNMSLGDYGYYQGFSQWFTILEKYVIPDFESFAPTFQYLQDLAYKILKEILELQTTNQKNTTPIIADVEAFIIGLRNCIERIRQVSCGWLNCKIEIINTNPQD